MASTDSWVDHRYRLQEKLGAGGMGEVYRAEDRLTGQVVALKRVTLPAEALQFASRGSSQEAEALRLSLAREFQTLASLRHPNIISVLDYGFDARQQPYFTMDYLAGAHTLVEAGRAAPPDTRIDLLLQTLQALAYLHRRGILHRDLKPGNVLVKDGVVRVLDFGLSADRESVTGISGTFEYMAPEVLREESISEAADLYAVGMMAYEMMAGRYPFAAPNISTRLVQILTTLPDFDGLDAPPELIAVVRRLLQKTPAQRYPNAEEVIAALLVAAKRPPLAESPAIRESFLQAATFTGRDAELASLTQALDEARGGHGSAWLIGGESGVGKSRLLDELRIRALVSGTLVLRGFASEGSLPYQLWRDVLPRLITTTTLTDLEAAVLKPLVPEIASLLGREIPDAPEAAASAVQQRLALTLDDLFRRQTRPILLLLEDLHWASEGLEILKQITRSSGDRPLLIVATYRDDETPSLPSSLPQMKPIRLERLSDAQIHQLSKSMLGEAGHNPKVLALLERETEGNVLFIVEVVRALAEDAGRLSDIGKGSLPERVMAGGMHMILRRRLDRVPAEHQSLLTLTAVAGRHIDLVIMPHLGAAERLDDFFIAGANAGVFDFRDGRWGFTHDKLRETLLADLSTEQLPDLHCRVAQAIEAAHPNDKAYASVLADHWRAAGDVQHEIAHLLDAASQMYDTSNFGGSQRYAERGLELTGYGDTGLSPDEIGALRTQFHRQVGNALERKADYPPALAAYQESLRLAEAQSDDRSRAAALISLANIAQHTGDTPTARQYAEQGVALFRMLGDEAGVAQGLIELAFVVNDYTEAKQILTEALGIARKLDKPVMEGRILNNIGIMSADLGELTFARECYIEALVKLRAVGERHSAAGVLNNLGLAAFLQGDFTEARQHFEQALVLNEQMGARSGIAHSLSNLGMVSKDTGQYDLARQYHERALELYREIGNPWGKALNLHHLAKLNAIAGDHPRARELYSESLALFREIDNPWGVALALGSTAWNDMKLGDYDRARANLVEALTAAKEIGSEPRLLWGLRTAVELDLLIGDAERGAEWLGLVLNHPASEQTTRTEMAALQPTFEQKLGAAACAEAMARGQSLPLDAVVSVLLGRASPYAS